MLPTAPKYNETMNSTDLVNGLKNGDKKIIDLLYDQYAGALYGIIIKIVKNEELAEDVLQDSFIKIWKNGPKFNASKGSLFTWMLNISRNTAIDKTRSSHYRQLESKQKIDFQITNHLNWSYTPKTEHIGLNKVVNGLDDKYREIIDLIYFQGFTQQEVHEHLNIPLGTVKSRLRIGLRELRTFFSVQRVSIIVLLIGLLG